MSNSDTDTNDLDAEVDDETASDEATLDDTTIDDDAGDDISDALPGDDDAPAPDAIADGAPDATGENEVAAADADDVAPEGEQGAEPEVAPEGEQGAEPEVLTDDELLEQQPVRVESPYDRPGRWFVVHTQSGYEKKVKQNLEARIVSMNAEETIYEVVIPMEDYVDFKNGKRVVAQRKMFPGYLLVRSRLDDTAWFVIRNTPGVTGFVGAGSKPIPLSQPEVDRILHTATAAAERPRTAVEFALGETVKITQGSLSDFDGEIVDVNPDQQKLKVLVDIFERQVPVELGFDQVKKID